MWKISKSFWRRKRLKAKKGPKQILKSFWKTKVETTWVYEKILFSALKVTIWPL